MIYKENKELLLKKVKVEMLGGIVMEIKVIEEKIYKLVDKGI